MNITQPCYFCGALPGDPCPKDDDACPLTSVKPIKVEVVPRLDRLREQVREQTDRAVQAEADKAVTAAQRLSRRVQARYWKRRALQRYVGMGCCGGDERA